MRGWCFIFLFLFVIPALADEKSGAELFRAEMPEVYQALKAHIPNLDSILAPLSKSEMELFQTNLSGLWHQMSITHTAEDSVELGKNFRTRFFGALGEAFGAAYIRHSLEHDGLTPQFADESSLRWANYRKNAYAETQRFVDGLFYHRIGDTLVVDAVLESKMNSSQFKQNQTEGALKAWAERGLNLHGTFFSPQKILIRTGGQTLPIATAMENLNSIEPFVHVFSNQPQTLPSWTRNHSIDVVPLDLNLVFSDLVALSPNLDASERARLETYFEKKNAVPLQAYLKSLSVVTDRLTGQKVLRLPSATHPAEKELVEWAALQLGTHPQLIHWLAEREEKQPGFLPPDQALAVKSIQVELDALPVDGRVGFFTGYAARARRADDSERVEKAQEFLNGLHLVEDPLTGKRYLNFLHGSLRPSDGGGLSWISATFGSVENAIDWLVDGQGELIEHWRSHASVEMIEAVAEIRNRLHALSAPADRHGYLISYSQTVIAAQDMQRKKNAEEFLDGLKTVTDPVTGHTYIKLAMKRGDLQGWANKHLGRQEDIFEWLLEGKGEVAENWRNHADPSLRAALDEITSQIRILKHAEKVTYFKTYPNLIRLAEDAKRSEIAKDYLSKIRLVRDPLTGKRYLRLPGQLQDGVREDKLGWWATTNFGAKENVLKWLLEGKGEAVSVWRREQPAEMIAAVVHLSEALAAAPDAKAKKYFLVGYNKSTSVADDAGRRANGVRYLSLIRRVCDPVTGVCYLRFPQKKKDDDAEFELTQWASYNVGDLETTVQWLDNGSGELVETWRTTVDPAVYQLVHALAGQLQPLEWKDRSRMMRSYAQRVNIAEAADRAANGEKFLARIRTVTDPNTHEGYVVIPTRQSESIDDKNAGSWALENLGSHIEIVRWILHSDFAASWRSNHREAIVILGSVAEDPQAAVFHQKRAKRFSRPSHGLCNNLYPEAVEAL